MSDDNIIEQFKKQIADAKQNSTTIRIRGGGSKDFYGVSLEGDLLETKSYSGISEYEPTELVITAKSGTPLKLIEKTLSENNQMLAFEPPHMGPEASFGGCIASGFSGPRRASQGAVRDLVLGVRMLNSEGIDLQFGGKVMKNVAGFDVSRLLAGSFGTLGLILECSVKVLPKPESERTIFMEMNQESALKKMNRMAGMSIPLSATCYDGTQLAARLSGSNIAVATALKKIGGESTDESSFWHSIKEHTHAFFNSEGCLYRLSMNPAAPMNAYPTAFIEWNGSTRWIWNNGSLSEHQAFANKHGGHAVAFRGNQAGRNICELPRALHAMQVKVKDALDPHRVFGKKRLFSEF